MEKIALSASILHGNCFPKEEAHYFPQHNALTHNAILRYVVTQYCWARRCFPAQSDTCKARRWS